MKNLLIALLLLCNITNAQTIKGFGDSNTEFWVDLPKEQKWLSLVAKELNFTVENHAHAGSTIYGGNGLESEKGKVSGGEKDYATFMYGTNDASKGMVNAQWKADYKTYVQHFINVGYDKNKLFIISPNYDPADKEDPNYLLQVQLAAQYSKEIAQELGTKYIGLYEEMKYQFEHPNSLSVYFRPSWWQVNGKHLNNRGHRLLADIFIGSIKPASHSLGTERVKLFGAGSAMAGISSYHHSFVTLFGNATGRHPKNYAIAGTGVGDINFAEVNSGTKEYIFLLFGNNDGNGSDAWKELYSNKVKNIIAAGYEPQKIVLFTVTIAPSLELNHNLNWHRIKAANNSIRQIASELNVRLVDTEQMFLNSGLFSDDYHINDAANEQLAIYLKTMLGTSVSLPLKFKSFDAKKIKGENKITVDFEVYEAEDTKQFNIMYAKDGKNFQTIEVVLPDAVQPNKKYSVIVNIPK